MLPNEVWVAIVTGGFAVFVAAIDRWFKHKVRAISSRPDENPQVFAGDVHSEHECTREAIRDVRDELNNAILRMRDDVMREVARQNALPLDMLNIIDRIRKVERP